MKNGIDVSHWQGNIDWERVAGSGISFAMIKAGNIWKNGGFSADANFAENLDGAVAAGLSVGVYAYIYATTTEAVERGAEALCATLDEYGACLSLPVAIDMEEAAIASTGRENCTNMAIAWRNIIKFYGLTPALYSNPTWLKSYVNLPAGMELWLAHYTTTPYCDALMWQYSAKGTVPGISGAVDLNYGYWEDETVPEAAETADTVEATEALDPISDIDYLSRAGIIQSPDTWQRIINGDIPVNLASHVIPLISKLTDAVRDKDSILSELQEIIDRR